MGQLQPAPFSEDTTAMYRSAIARATRRRAGSGGTAAILADGLPFGSSTGTSIYGTTGAVEDLAEFRVPNQP
jgi:hypothetical protein